MNKITILLLLICALNMAGYATSKPNPMRTWNAGEVMEAYVKTVSQGEPEWVEHLFMDYFEYYLHATNERYTKKHFVKFLKSMSGYRYDCKTDYTVLDENASACIAKMTMQFENFTRTDYIYLRATQSGWQVSKVLVEHIRENQPLL
ncbi:MAG: hypothetical protein K0S31_2100 [Sphingobacterium multivorum]|nr:hypothetical protein [Sphingobacterium multivorum]